MPLPALLFGAIVGVSLGLTGGGGAIFAVPLLVYGLAVPPREAVGISLVSVGLTALVGFLQRWRSGQVELRTGFLFAAAGMLGAPFGSWIANRLPETLLMLLFAGLMLTIAVRMWRRSAVQAREAQPCSPDDLRDGPTCQRDAAGQLILTSRCARLLLLTGVLAGVLAGMFGVGGGFIIVPALVLFSGMSMLRAVGTSLLVIFLISCSGVVSLLWSGSPIPVGVSSLFVAGGIGGLFAGQAVGNRLSVRTLQKVFAAAILLVAVFVIVRNAGVS